MNANNTIATLQIAKTRAENEVNRLNGENNSLGIRLIKSQSSRDSYYDQVSRKDNDNRSLRNRITSLESELSRYKDMVKITVVTGIMGESLYISPYPFECQLNMFRHNGSSLSPFRGMKRVNVTSLGFCTKDVFVTRDDFSKLESSFIGSSLSYRLRFDKEVELSGDI